MLAQTQWVEELTWFAPSGWMWLGGAAGALLLLVLLGWGVVRLLFYKRVPELEVAVVFNSRTGNFSRFLGPGLHRLGWREHIENKISLAPSKVRRGKCADVHTYDGILFSIEWTLTYHLDPLTIEADQQSSAARWLPNKNTVEDFIRDKVDHCLRKVVGKRNSRGMYAPETQAELEEAAEELLKKSLAPMGIKPYSIMLGAIRGTKKVEEAFEEALKHQVAVDGETKALRQLDEELVHKIKDDKEMKHLEELERIYTLGEHGVALPYRPDAGREKGNGET